MKKFIDIKNENIKLLNSNLNRYYLDVDTISYNSNDELDKLVKKIDKVKFYLNNIDDYCKEIIGKKVRNIISLFSSEEKSIDEIVDTILHSSSAFYIGLNKKDMDVIISSSDNCVDSLIKYVNLSLDTNIPTSGELDSIENELFINSVISEEYLRCFIKYQDYWCALGGPSDDSIYLPNENEKYLEAINILEGIESFKKIK